LTPGASCKNHVFWTFWWFLDWISAKLALIWSKMHLQHDSLLRHAANSKFFVLRLFDFLIFFRLSFFSFSFLFAVVIDLLLGLLSFKKLLMRRHRDGQFFEHFLAYLGLHSANHPDLCIIGKMFSSCRS